MARPKRDQREYLRAYYIQNREALLAKCRERYKLHRESIKLRVKLRARKLPVELKREKHRQWRVRNRARCRINNAKWREKNKDKLALQRRQRNRLNPHIDREKQIRRRAQKRGVKSENCSATIKALRRKLRCYWCRGRINKMNRTIDHVIPLARGGAHAPDNLVASCRTCNSSKHDKLYWGWDEELAS